MVYWAQGVISFLISYFLRLTKFSFKIMQKKIEFVDYWECDGKISMETGKKNS